MLPCFAKERNAMRILTVFGTRPEAIKLAPVIQAFEHHPGITSITCSTGQHGTMLDQALALFELRPDHDLGLMKSGQNLAHITITALAGVSDVLATVKPDWVVVQGDTTTAFSAALAAFYHRIPVAHVEAGLRTGNRASPYPEEVNRKLISQLATLHFPPTEWAAQNLYNEAVRDADIVMTGNTVIDALKYVSAKMDADPLLQKSILDYFNFLDPAKKLILVTGHRRENFERGLANMCSSLLILAARNDIEIVYPVHLNPDVQKIVVAMLAGNPGIHLIEPQSYMSFVYLMKTCHFIITDSGGIQEEAPTFGKPVLVTRDTTERPEGVKAGIAFLIGREVHSLVTAATQLLDDDVYYGHIAAAKNPYGDGHASERIVAALLARAT